MNETLGDLVQAAMLLHERYAERSVGIVEDFLRGAAADGNASELARWSTILRAVRELERA